jgi:hypothetical protein
MINTIQQKRVESTNEEPGKMLAKSRNKDRVLKLCVRRNRKPILQATDGLWTLVGGALRRRQCYS